MSIITPNQSLYTSPAPFQSPPSTEAFLDAILPTNGMRCVVALTEAGARQSFYPNNAAAAQAIERYEAQGVPVYFACATFKDASSRRASNVAAIKSHWLDIDCGEGRDYQSKRAALAALISSINQAGLPQPSVVCSGRGWHVYWTLVAEIDPETWLQGSKQLKRLCELSGLRADPTRTADAASILRPPGTSNRKDPANPLPVTVLRMGVACEHVALHKLLTGYVERHGADGIDGTADVLSARPDWLPGFETASNADLSAGVQAGWFDALAPADKDACVASMLAVPAVVAIADQERGEWLRIVMACAQCQAPDAKNLCRQWSMTSARYDAAAFDRDWRSALKSADRITIGTLIHAAQEGGWDAARWRAVAGADDQQAADAAAPVASPNGLDMARFAVSPIGTSVPPRRWLLGRVLIRQQYTMLAAPGGRGKSALAIVTALSAATGRDLLNVGDVRPARVLLVNAEDGQEELQRRMKAAAIHYRIGDADVAGRIFAVGAGQVPGLILNRVNPLTRQGEISAAGFALLESMIVGAGAEIIILDPLVALCPAGLNDNAVAAAVMREITQLAVRLNIAVLIVHHVRKGTLGQEASQEDASGAAALVNLSRVGLGIERLDPADALKVGVMPGDAWRYFALVNTKANLAPLQERQWFQLETVTLANADPADGYPDGDAVQVVVPFTPQVAGSLLSPQMLRAVAVRLAQGCKGGTEPFCPSIKAKGETNFKAAAGRALALFFPTEAQAGLERLAVQAVAELAEKGFISEVTVSRSGRNRGKGLLVRWHETPWGEEPEPGRFVG